MNKLVKISEDIDQEKLSVAEDLHAEVLARTYITAGNLLELGKLFKEIRDKKHYKLLGAETFNEYCGFPEISFGRSTIYSFIYVYELYVLKLDYHPTTLSKIGHRKLQIISPIMKDFVREKMETGYWIESAGILSESDLINEVRRAQNKPEMIPKPKEVENEPFPFSFEEYLDFVKTHACIICGEKESDNAHFPQSRGAGGRDSDCIPLCRKCHTLSHHDLYDWLWLNKNKVFRYFYDIVLEAYSIIRRNKV